MNGGVKISGGLLGGRVDGAKSGADGHADDLGGAISYGLIERHAEFGNTWCGRSWNDRVGLYSPEKFFGLYVDAVGVLLIAPDNVGGNGANIKLLH